ncbi:MAG: hypothetical protein VXW44_04020, partial [SAR324 cluster bacterium]|nr:hypothetical protein [SAR324 cluster bacterium]
MSLRKLIKKSLLVLGTGVVLTTVLPVGGIAQDNINTPGNIFSQWVKLSLMGYNQSEIEATLNVYQSEEIQLVKRRLLLSCWLLLIPLGASALPLQTAILS